MYIYSKTPHYINQRPTARIITGTHYGALVKGVKISDKSWIKNFFRFLIKPSFNAGS